MFFIDTLVWLAENAWALILHLAGRSSFPAPLSKDEEAQLIKRLQAGDADAREALITHNLRLVAHISKKYAQSGVEADDLVSIGSIGLIKAVNTFDPESGRLTAYASRCIDNEILMYLRANRKNKSTLSLTDPIGADREGNEISLLDLLSTNKDEVPELAELAIESKRAIELMSHSLDAREISVITMRFGLFDGVQTPQHEIAARLHISRSYVSRIEKRALEKLRKALMY